MKVLLSWIGSTDEECGGNSGPIFDVLKEIQIEKAIFLIDYERTITKQWMGGPVPTLKKFFPSTYTIVKRITMESCNDFDSIYKASNKALLDNCKSEVYINLASGSKIMCACWTLAVERLSNDFREPTMLRNNFGSIFPFTIKEK